MMSAALETRHPRHADPLLNEFAFFVWHFVEVVRSDVVAIQIQARLVRTKEWEVPIRVQ